MGRESAAADVGTEHRSRHTGLSALRHRSRDSLAEEDTDAPRVDRGRPPQRGHAQFLLRLVQEHDAGSHHVEIAHYHVEVEVDQLLIRRLVLRCLTRVGLRDIR
jgi:hypothetical protein